MRNQFKLGRRNFIASVEAAVEKNMVSLYPPKAVRSPEEEVAELRRILAALLELPVAKSELAYLHKGIGTATQNAVWLEAEDYLRRTARKVTV